METRWLVKVAAAIAAMAPALLPGCTNFDPRASSDGLKPGMNYMQPLKWRMTYTYRVAEIKPNQRMYKKQDSALFPGIPAVGKGTYEVWLAGPLECEDCRAVKMTVTNPAPTKVAKAKDSDATFVYYDFAPDGYLPQEINASVTWEFVTFERYAFWDGMQPEDYDKAGALYKQYTKLEAPIDTHPGIKKTAKECIPENDPLNFRETAHNAYNYELQHFVYSFDSLESRAYTGLAACSPSFRAWENKSGVCDELTNVYCSLMREAGIPARPVAGWVHDRSLGFAGGHAWAEFYLPGAGWVPVDPTWGVYDEIIDQKFSMLGFKRQISQTDYYFGKHEPYRIVLFKDWNYTLNPPPRTPKAKKSETFMVGYTDRMSGVHEVVSGFETLSGKEGRFGGAGWYRSAKAAVNNFRPEVVCLGPPTKAELAELKKQIQAEGGHYLQVPTAPWNYPVTTTRTQ